MAILKPFSFSFSCPQGANVNSIGTRVHKLLRSLSVYIEDDNKGPILVNVHVLVEGKKHQLDQPTGIYDGEGSNAKRFSWTGELPLSLITPNVITIQHTNYSGEDIDSVRVSGVVQKR